MVHGSKILNLALDDYGAYLGMDNGCFVIRDRHAKTQRYPLFENEIGEVTLKSGNCVSTGALASLAFWEIDCLIVTQKGRPVAILKSLEDDSHVKTRISQYEAIQNGKGIYIAKQLVLSKVESQNIILDKYDLKPQKPFLDNFEFQNLETARKKLLPIEGKFCEFYFNQIFQLFPEKLRPKKRTTYKAYDGINNAFNLAYEVLSWKVYRALIKAKLEPYLGFLHSIQFGKPSLICDFQELYRYLIDDFLIEYCQKLRIKDFTVKTESVARNRKGKREYLNGVQTSILMKKLNAFFEFKVEIPRIKVGNRQTIETLINEEALLFAKYLRHERETWKPRIYSYKVSEKP